MNINYGIIEQPQNLKDKKLKKEITAEKALSAVLKIKKELNNVRYN